MCNHIVENLTRDVQPRLLYKKNRYHIVGMVSFTRTPTLINEECNEGPLCCFIEYGFLCRYSV